MNCNMNYSSKLRMNLFGTETMGHVKNMLKPFLWENLIIDINHVSNMKSNVQPKMGGYPIPNQRYRICLVWIN